MPRLRQIGIDVEVHRTIEQARLSFAESENDILRRLLARTKPRRAGADRFPGASASPGSPRARGIWTVEICGNRDAASNLKDAYRVLLETLAARFPDFIDKFSQERARSRRFVARDPALLYLSAPHLAEKHAGRLSNGWFFDTNLSTAQVSKRVRIAARTCGLLYGRDVRILDNMQEI